MKIARSTGDTSVQILTRLPSCAAMSIVYDLTSFTGGAVKAIILSHFIIVITISQASS
jgi:hypothetical protein